MPMFDFAPVTRGEQVAYMHLTRRGLPREIVMKILRTANPSGFAHRSIIRRMRRQLLYILYGSVLRKPGWQPRAAAERTIGRQLQRGGFLRWMWWWTPRNPVTIKEHGYESGDTVHFYSDFYDSDSD